MADCIDGACGYGLWETAAKDGTMMLNSSCDVGGGSCRTARLLELDESPIHDKTLQDATRKIKEILESIPTGTDGRELSFLHTKNGTVLAWIQHGVKFPPDAVTFESDPDEVDRLLRVKNPEPAQIS